jgi:hypothetical protein
MSYSIVQSKPLGNGANMLEPPIFQSSSSDLAESIGIRFLMAGQQRIEDHTSIVSRSSPPTSAEDFDPVRVQESAEYAVLSPFDEPNKADVSFAQTTQARTKRGGNVCETCNKVSH